VLEKNPDTVELVFKNYPLRSHKYARTAAIAALAAGKQGKFWEFHNELFAIYQQINDEKIIEIAEKLALNMPQFQSGIQDPSIRAIVDNDFQEGVRIGIRGVPTVYINGKQFRGRSLEDYQAEIDTQLKK